MLVKVKNFSLYVLSNLRLQILRFRYLKPLKSVLCFCAALCFSCLAFSECISIWDTHLDKLHALELDLLERNKALEMELLEKKKAVELDILEQKNALELDKAGAPGRSYRFYLYCFLGVALFGTVLYVSHDYALSQLYDQMGALINSSTEITAVNIGTGIDVFSASRDLTLQSFQATTDAVVASREATSADFEGSLRVTSKGIKFTHDMMKVYHQATMHGLEAIMQAAEAGRKAALEHLTSNISFLSDVRDLMLKALKKTEVQNANNSKTILEALRLHNLRLLDRITINEASIESLKVVMEGHTQIVCNSIKAASEATQQATSGKGNS